MKVYNFLNKKLFFLFVLTTIIVACEEKDAGELENVELTSSTKVFLDPSNASSVSEASNIAASADGSTLIAGENTAEIAVLRTGTDFSQAATVDFTYSAIYSSTSDFFDKGDDASSSLTFSNEGSITIPAGSSRGSIVVVIGDDLLATGNRSLTITLDNTSLGELGFSSSDPKITQTIDVIDDDCPIAIADWVGTYTVDENFTDGVNAPFGLSDFFGESYQVEITLDPSDNTGTKVLIATSDGFDPYFFPNDPLSMTFLTCPQQVKFDPEAPTVGFGFRNFEFETSSYNVDKFTIKCEGPLSTFGPYQFTLTKQAE